MKYRVTDAMEGAKTVAGFPNPGVGKAIVLTEDQAAHPLRLGHVEAIDTQPAPSLTSDANPKEDAKK